MPHAIWWCQVVTRGPWVVPGHCQGVARWFLGAKRMCWKVEKKVFLAPWHQEGWVLGVPLYVLVGVMDPRWCWAGDESVVG